MSVISEKYRPIPKREGQCGKESEDARARCPGTKRSSRSFPRVVERYSKSTLFAPRARCSWLRPACLRVLWRWPWSPKERMAYEGVPLFHNEVRILSKCTNGHKMAIVNQLLPSYWMGNHLAIKPLLPRSTDTRVARFALDISSVSFDSLFLEIACPERNLCPATPLDFPPSFIRCLVYFLHG